MEIDKAIKESDDRRLKTKYNNAIYVIQRALALYSIEELAFSFNGGKDSTVLLHLLRAGYFLHKGGQSCSDRDLTSFPIRTIYFESSSAFPEISSFTYDTASRDVWAFILTCKVEYCKLYDQGYTSIGSVHDTVPNSLLCINDSSCNKKFKPAYLLADGRLERAGRVKKLSLSIPGHFPVFGDSPDSVDPHKNGMLVASVIAVGDEILFGTVEDQLGTSLCRKLHSIGWSVSQIAIVQNDIDSMAEEVERHKSTNDMVFIYGGVGPLQSDVTLAGVAKAFGVRLAPDEEFEEYLRHLIGNQCTGDRNEMALLPEGITELLHHEKLPVPMIKCQNVIILVATNVAELDKEWKCLTELTKSYGLFPMMEPFVSKRLTTNLLDVEIAQPLSKLCLEFPDINIGVYRKCRNGSLIISFQGKKQVRVDLAVEALCNMFHPRAFTEIN
ncbi:uncharacterized protein LOC110635429 isoform X3 [Hevea brasiliensis]|uniref:uncharacterized protein LOC110635429 isoform X3 n=1 Tax=Hevea brasiliensis TaxID=3981 RepID=UPI000B777A06|nr:uncharacterized protein LOC110635429 isoform X3 [Hevea brasiliensis]